MSGTVSVGVIGLGEVGRHQVNGVLQSSGKLAAIADLDANALAATAKSTGAKPYASAEDLIADPNLDAVVICVPHKYHFDLCRKALNAGKHVLVEKPATVTSAQCTELIDLAASKGKLFGASHNQLFYPPHIWLKSEIAHARIKRPTILRLRLAIGGKLGGWRADPDLTGGGLLFDAGFHRFYVARSIMGEVKAVTASLDTDKPREIGEDYGIIILEFRDGGRAVIEAGYHAPKGAFDDQIEAVSADALIRIPGLEAHFEKFSSEPHLLRWKDGSWSAVDVDTIDWTQTVGRAVGNFVDAIQGRAKLAADGAESHRIVEIVEAVYRSSIEGRRIEI